jgi:hypothetical protein
VVNTGRRSSDVLVGHNYRPHWFPRVCPNQHYRVHSQTLWWCTMPSVSFSRLISSPVSRKDIHHDTQVVEDFGPNWGTGPVRLFELQKTWVRTPRFFQDYRGKIRRRFDLPMNQYSYYKRVINYPVGGIAVTYTEPWTSPGPYEIQYVGPVANIASPPVWPDSRIEMPPLDLNELDNKAKTNFLLELKDQKVNLVQAFAERGQTVRLLGNTISRLAGAATALKRGSFAAAARSLGVKASPRRVRKYTKSWSEDQSKALANGWLELQYGWRPLITDIYGAAEQLAQTNVREVRNIVRKSASKFDTVRQEIAPVNGNPKFYCTVIRRTTIKYVVYYSTPVGTHSLTQIGLTNPLLIAWELTPWSFVADWILPLGNYISTLDATNSLVFEKGCRTQFQEVTVFGKGRSGAAQAGVNWDYDLSSDSKEINIERTTLSSFPEVNLPKFKNPFSVTHVLNSIALLRTNLRVR